MKMRSTKKRQGFTAESKSNRSRLLRLEPLENRQLLNVGPGSQAIELFRTSPALFVENQGQWADDSIRYLHQGEGMSVAMTDTGPVFHLFRGELMEDAETGEELYDALNLVDDLHRPKDVFPETTQFSARFVGANAVEPQGLNEAKPRFNYYLDTEEDGYTDVRSYEVVSYENLYEGIDLQTWGRCDSLKYEFRVAPGADYRQIEVAYEGIDRLRLDESGALCVETALGTLVDDAPYIYQEYAGQQVEVPGRFEIVDPKTYKFVVTGNFDPNKELIVDPSLAWATCVGGTRNDQSYAITVDPVGDIVVTGRTQSSGGGWVGLVAKLDPGGEHLWSTYFGVEAKCYGIATDSFSNILITGATTMLAVNTRPSGYTNGYKGGGTDGFVIKLSANGGRLWGTFLGGTSEDSGADIAMDSSGNILATGTTSSADWAVDGHDTTYNGDRDAFIAKISPDGEQIWSTYVGGSETDLSSGIAVNGSGDILVAGTSFGAAGEGDAFVAKYRSDGSCHWSKYFGGSKSEGASDIALDSSGNILVVGGTNSPDWIEGGYDTVYHNPLDPTDGHSGYDAFVVKLSPSGTHLWSTYLGGNDFDGSAGIAVDPWGDILITGTTESPGWVKGGYRVSDNNLNGLQTDAFVVKLRPDGGHVSSTYLGGWGQDNAAAITVDDSGNALVTGNTYYPYGWTEGAVDDPFYGTSEAFVAKLMNDSDGDGLLDFWETQGIDVNGDGTPDLILNTDPMHKDLFVEVDAMVGLAPSQATLDRVVAAFADAPKDLVNNPDGKKGVSLHIEYDPSLLIARQSWTGDLDGDGVTALNGDPDDMEFAFFDVFKVNHFGTEADSAEVLEAKRMVYRYCVFADQYVIKDLQENIIDRSSGLAELNGNDFMVTLGAWKRPGPDGILGNADDISGGTADEQAGTFMHELGHTLGLQHGGADAITFKPNYYSVMNYHWQVPSNKNVGWKLDYSQESLPTLFEGNLNESDGIGFTAGGPHDVERYRVAVGPYDESMPNNGLLLASDLGPVDWSRGDRDGDGVPNNDVGITADINHVRKDESSPGQVLHGHEDWSTLNYNFRDSPSYVDGVRDNDAIPDNEITPEIYQFLGRPKARVDGRHVLYDNSTYDTGDGKTDNGAIAPNKVALLPGHTATQANYSNYSRGINGVVVDIGFPADLDNLSAADFEFRIGNSNDPGTWADAPQPMSLLAHPGEGVYGSDRITITWPDNAVKNQWLQVTVKATENTGLLEDDIFYFGNAIGEAGDQATNTIVNATDEIAARNFQHSALNPALIDDPYDYNRDGLVNATDQIIARENQTNPLTMLRLITAPAADAAIKQAHQEAPNALSAALDWQYEFESMQSKTAKRKDVEATVDLLLATDWQ